MPGGRRLDMVIESIALLRGGGSSGVVSSAWSCEVPNSGVSACMFHRCWSGASGFSLGVAAFISDSSENRIEASF